MVARKSLLAVGLLTLVVAVSFGSYASVGNQVSAKEDTTPSEATIEQHALGNNTTVDSVSGTVTITTDGPDGNQTVEADIWQRTPDHVRYEYTDGPQAGTEMVSNGSDLWMYNDTTNTARYLRLDGENAGLIQNMSKAFQGISDGFEANYQGTATVSGHETYVVSLQPKNESMQNMMGNATVWLDQENWFPVKERITTKVGNESTTTTMTYSNLSYNASIPDDRFTFTPPEDAHVIDVTLPQTSTYSSVDAAQKAVDYTIREPSSVPDGYSLENVTVTTSSGDASVSLEYTNGSDTLTVSQTPATRTIDGDETVSIAGHDGSYSSVDDRGIVQWSDGEHGYSVVGSLSEEELVDFAESLYC